MGQEIQIEQGTAPNVVTITGIHTPERAAAMRQAAAETLGDITVRTYNPDDPKEREAYAALIASSERQAHEIGLVEIGGRTTPRTPEQIDRQVIEYAIRNGFELVAVESRQSGSLREFNQRVDQIAPLGSATHN